VNDPVYLLAGEEFLVEGALEQVRAEARTDPLSEVTVSGNVTVPEMVTALETPSLLGGRRMVVVRDAEGLTKEAGQALSEYLESPSPHSVLVLVAAGRTRLDSSVKKLGRVINLDAPKGRRLVSWLRRRATERTMKLDDRAAWALIDSVGADLRELDSALNQLETGLGAGSRVGVAEVRNAFPRSADQRIYVFTDAVGDRRLPLAMASLRRLLNQGEDPLVLFGALTAQVRRMLRARRYADQGGSAVGDALGLPTWRAERLSKQARLYRENELTDALATLAVTDVEIKGGDLPPEAALERAVVHIVSS
jgi:DNA polymerase III subunit delta